MSNHILLAPHRPLFSAFRPEQVLPSIEQALADFESALARVLAAQPQSFEQLFMPLERADEKLARAFSTISHMHNVCDSEALRAPYAKAQEWITRFTTELKQNRALFEHMQAFAQSPAATKLSAPERRVLENWLRDFRLGGVALPEPERLRLKAISERLSALAIAFEEALLDATDAFSLHVLDKHELIGIPRSFKTQFKQAAKAKGLEGYLLDLRGPSYQAVMTYAKQRALRERYYRAYATRASEQYPCGSQFDNGPRIREMLELKQEAAQLLGFKHAAEESLEERMAPDVATVFEFLERLSGRAKPHAEAELRELAEFARSDLGIEHFEPWDVAFSAEKLKLARYAFDDEALRPYFPLERVLSGFWRLVGKLFQINAQERAVDSWHPDVRYFELSDHQGKALAGCYLDLFARSKKRGGAWMDVCRQRIELAEGVQLPIAYVNANFAPPGPEQAALLTHDEVLTLFHEFGHALHHMLTKISIPSISGIEGVEWDAVELPSQFMENFCWTEAGLQEISGHIETGAPLPKELLHKLKETRYFHAGLFLVRQLEFGLFDFHLHARSHGFEQEQVLALLEQVRAKVAVIKPPAWHRFPHSFSHIFGGGYAAGYYSYLWAEVLSADAFSAFPEQAPIDAERGQRFKHEVLEVGGSRAAAESFRALMGRDPDISALLRSYGLAREAA
jgi:oligopeptidase A